MLGATELLVIAMAFLLLFGPDKIPKIARDFGRAWGELRKFQDELAKEVNATGIQGVDLGLDGVLSPTPSGPTRTPLPSGSSFKLRQMARKMGIDVEGKSDPQIIDAINVQMGKLASREDGRALFKELQEETREQRERKAREKAAQLGAEAAKETGKEAAGDGGDGSQPPAPTATDKPTAATVGGAQAGEAEPAKPGATAGGE